MLQPDKLKKLNENALKMSEAGKSKEDILAMKDAFIKQFGNEEPVKKKVPTEIGTSTSTSQNQKSVSGQVDGSLDLPNPNNQFSRVIPKAKTPKTSKTVVSENFETTESPMSLNVAKLKQYNPEITKLSSEYEQAKLVPESKVSEIRNEVENKFAKKGVLNNLQTGAKKFVNAIAYPTQVALSGGNEPEPLFELDEFADEKKEVQEKIKKEQALAKKQNKPIPTWSQDQIDYMVKERKIAKLVRSEKESQVRSFLESKDEAYTQDEFGRTERERMKIYDIQNTSSLNEKDKLNLKKQDVVLPALTNTTLKIKEYNEKIAKKEPLSADEIEDYKYQFANYDKLTKEAIELKKEYLNTQDKLGDSKENLDLFNREYSWGRHFKNLDATVRDIVSGGIGAVDYGIEATNYGLEKLGLPANPLSTAIQPEARRISKSIKSDADKIRSEIAKPVSVENINNWNDFGNWVADTAVSQAPIFALIATGAPGLTTIGGYSTGDKYESMLEEMRPEPGKLIKNYSEEQLLAIPAIFGASEVVSATVDLYLFKNASRVYNSASRQERQLIVDGMAKRFLNTSGNVVKSVGVETVDETFTQGVQNFADIYIGGDKNKKLTDGFKDVASAGFFMGAMLNVAPMVVAKATKKFSTDNSVEKVNKEILALEFQLDNKDLTDNSRNIIQEQLAKAKEKSKSLLEKRIGDMESLSNAQFNEINRLEKTQANIQNKAKEIKNDNSVNTELKKQILDNLKSEFSANEQRRINLLQRGASVQIERLPEEEQIRLKDKASRELMKEKNPDGTANITINDDEISKRAIQIYNNEIKQKNEQLQTTTTETKPQTEVQKPTIAEQEKIKYRISELNNELEQNRISIEKGEITNRSPKDIKQEIADLESKLPKEEIATLSVSESFNQAGENAKSKQDGKIIGRWILDNSKTGDTITLSDGTGYEITNSKNGEIEITPFETNEKGEREYVIEGVRLVTENQLKHGDLFESSYENNKGERVTEQYSYNEAISKPQEVSPVEDVVATSVEGKIPSLEEAEYKEFVNNNIVSNERLVDIADKVKKAERLTPYENSIFHGKTSEINKIIADAGKENGDITADGNVSVGTEPMEQVGIEEKPTTEVVAKESVQPANDVKPIEGETEVDYALKQIDKGVLTWNGDIMSPRIDLGMSWADIRKGEADLKRGKVDSVPAKRLIEALSNAKKEGGYRYKLGTGGANMRSSEFVSFEDMQRLENEYQLTDSELEEINTNQEQLAKEYDDYINSLDEETQNEILENYESKPREIVENTKVGEGKNDVSNEKEPSRKETRKKIAEATIDDFANALKDLLPKANTEGVKKQGLSQDDIIDFVAKNAKLLANTGIEIDEAIRQVIAKLKDNFEDLDVNIDDVKAKLEPKKETIEREVFVAEKGKHSVILRLSKGDNAEREIEAINKADFNYEVRNQDKVNRDVENFIKDVGIAQAYKAVKEGKIEKFDTVALIYNAILQQMPIEHEKLISEMTSEEDILRAEESYVNEFSQVSKEFSVLLTNLGQGVSVMNYIYNKNENIKYSLEQQKNAYKSKNNGVIPKDVEEKYQKASKRLEEVNELIKKKEAELSELENTVLVEEIEKSIKRQKESTTKAKAPLTESEQKRKKQLSRKFFGQLNDITRFAVIIADPEFREYLGLSFKEVKGDLTNFTNKIVSEIGSGARKFIDEMFNIAKEENEISQANSIKINNNGKVRIPKSIIESLIEKGFKDINSISQEVFNLLKEKHPELSLRQIKESIVGYGRDVAKTRPDIDIEIGRLRRVGQLELEIEDLENGIKKAKTERKQIEQSAKIIDLKAKKRQLEDQLGITEENRTERTKQYTKRRIIELKERIAKGDFSKKEIKPVKQDAELRSLRAEKLELQEIFSKEQYKLELKNRSSAKKIFDSVFDILNIKRVGLTTGEFSPMFVQGGALTVRNILRNPKQFLSDFRNMFKAMASTKYYKQTEQDIKSSDIFDIIRDAKLGIVETDTKQTAKEELFQHQILESVFDLGAEQVGKLIKSQLTEKYGEKRASEIAENVERITKEYVLILRPFERANNVYMNSLRYNRFKEGVKMLEAQGKNPIDNLEDYKRVASAINTLTGRSNLGALEQYKQGLGLIFFSAKLMASTWQKVNPMHYWALRDSENWKKPSVAQKMLFVDALTHYAFMASITLLMKAVYNAVSDDEDEEATVEIDPRSSDFMKFKLGNVRLDFFGTGLAPFVLFSRLYTEEVMKADGEIYKMGKSNTKSRGDYLGKYFVNKLNPLTSGVYQELNSTEKEYEGKTFREDDWGTDFSFKKYMTDVMPIIYGTGVEVMEEQPNLFGSLIMIQAAFGVNPSVYGNDDKGVKDRPDVDENGNKTVKSEKFSYPKTPSLPKPPSIGR